MAKKSRNAYDVKRPIPDSGMRPRARGLPVGDQPLPKVVGDDGRTMPRGKTPDKGKAFRWLGDDSDDDGY